MRGLALQFQSDMERIEHSALRIASEHYTRLGFDVRDVTHAPGHNGFDLLAVRGEEALRIEVKGCSRLWGIPDLYSTEFDAERRLVADVLCVVYFIPDQPGPRICLIPREALPPEFVVPKAGFRIKSGFKKKARLEQFCVDTEAPSGIDG